jgi:hypothetical protein
MDRAATFDRLSALSPEVAQRLRRALEQTQRRKPQEAGGEETQLYREALVAAGICSDDPRTQFARGIPRAETLTQEQRIVVEILANVRGIELPAKCVFRAAWARRQWIGREPPGPLFAIEVDGKPAWLALQEAGFNGLALLRGLEVEKAIPIAVEARVSMEFDCSPSVGTVLIERAPGIGKGLGAWARQQADRLLDLFAADVPLTERGGHPFLEMEVRFPVFLALVRAKERIEPRWDALFPIGTWMKPEWYRECLDALEPARRESAIDAALALR